MFKKFFLTLLIFSTLNSLVSAQTSSGGVNGRTNNYIESAVPFLTIASDSRSGAMGDVGAAISPDINSMQLNPSIYAFIENEMGVSFSYTPWLRNLVGDIDLAYLTAYKRFGKSQVVAMSFRYFALGDIELTDDRGEQYNTIRPNEFSIDAAYARSFLTYRPMDCCRPSQLARS